MKREDLKAGMALISKDGRTYIVIDTDDGLKLFSSVYNLNNLYSGNYQECLDVNLDELYEVYTRQGLWEQFIKNEYFDDNKVFQFTLAVLSEFDYSEFIKAPGSSVYHHNYEGGLKVHTDSVVEYCLNIASKIPYINKSILISAAYLHDMGKMFDYRINEETKEIEITTEGRLVYHICSVLPFIEKHLNLISKKDFLHIKHCILAHHGKHEWKSPVTPQTPEAYILHTADMLSSRLDDYKPNNNQEWQSHLKSFGPVWNPNYEEKEHGC